ncbi:MAG: aminotransferase class I/II-fold pyridoxal phosphate-dependent enzyme, partial [Phycisphaerae bacterium]
SGVFGAVQQAAVAALAGIERPEVRRQVAVYRRRRDILVDGLRRAGTRVVAPSATPYVWAPCPRGDDSMSWATRLLAEANVVAIPGVGFGLAGEGYVRFALTVSEARTREAVDRLAGLNS